MIILYYVDWCGICGGDNSTCKEEGGAYNRTEYGYNMVVRIPSGKIFYLVLGLADGNNNNNITHVKI